MAGHSAREHFQPWFRWLPEQWLARLLWKTLGVHCSCNRWNWRVK